MNTLILFALAALPFALLWLIGPPPFLTHDSALMVAGLSAIVTFYYALARGT